MLEWQKRRRADLSAEIGAPRATEAELKRLQAEEEVLRSRKKKRISAKTGGDAPSDVHVESEAATPDRFGFFMKGPLSRDAIRRFRLCYAGGSDCRHESLGCVARASRVSDTLFHKKAVRWRRRHLFGVWGAPWVLSSVSDNGLLRHVRRGRIQAPFRSVCACIGSENLPTRKSAASKGE